MADKKLIAVVGATGAQGGGVVQAILKDKAGPFRVRAITRNPGSDAGKALAAQGAEVVAGDLADPKSLDRAFAGAHGVYGVTFYWAHMNPEKETADAKAIADAARRAGTKHVIWSTLEDTRKLIPLSDNRMPTLLGRYKVPHFDAKAEADPYFLELGVPTTFLLASFYWENFIFFGAGPKPGPDGKLLLTMPMGGEKLAGIAAADIGACAYGIFKRGGEFIGKRVGLAGDQLTGSEMAAGLSKALGREVRYNDVPPEVYRSFGFPGADDMGNMFQYYRDFAEAVNSVRSVEGSRALYPGLQSFDQWLAKNASRIPLE
jgi:uncharacterized protein YbjT (DUF2867 family)